MIGYIEKRADKRAEFNQEIKYKLIGDESTKVQVEYITAKTKNISKGGLCIIMPHKINEGNVIRVEIPIDNNSKYIKAFCEVQWCKENSTGSFDVGVSFIALREDDLEYLNKYILTHAM